MNDNYIYTIDNAINASESFDTTKDNSSSHSNVDNNYGQLRLTYSNFLVFAIGFILLCIIIWKIIDKFCDD